MKQTLQKQTWVGEAGRQADIRVADGGVAAIACQNQQIAVAVEL